MYTHYLTKFKDIYKGGEAWKASFKKPKTKMGKIRCDLHRADYSPKFKKTLQRGTLGRPLS